MTLSLILRRGLLGCTLIAIFAVGMIVGQNMYGMPKTVIHTVTLKWKADSTPAQQQKALDGVKEMAAAIPGVKNVWLKKLKVQGPSAEVPFDWAFVIEFADPETYARGLASSGPAFEAIQSIGEDAFLARAAELASGYVRDGLPLRGLLQVFGYVGTKQ